MCVVEHNGQSSICKLLLQKMSNWFIIELYVTTNLLTNSIIGKYNNLSIRFIPLYELCNQNMHNKIGLHIKMTWYDIVDFNWIHFNATLNELI